MSTSPWSTPHMRAERAHLEAAKCMETRDVAGARAKTRETIGFLREFLRALDRDQAELDEIEIRRAEFKARTRGEAGA